MLNTDITSCKTLAKNPTHNFPYTIDWCDVCIEIDLSSCFYESDFNRNSLVNWDVSRVVDMTFMFKRSKYNYALANWNTGHVHSMYSMFCESSYNHPLASWNVIRVRIMQFMFFKASYNHPLSRWSINDMAKTVCMFSESKYSYLTPGYVSE